METVPPTVLEMDQDDLISENSDSEMSESSEGAMTAFDDYMLSLLLEQRRMLAVILMESFKLRQKINMKDAAFTITVSIVGFNEETVRRNRSDFFSNKGKLTLSRQGKYELHCVYHDEDLNRKAREWECLQERRAEHECCCLL